MTSLCPQARRPGEAHWWGVHPPVSAEEGGFTSLLDMDVSLTVQASHRSWVQHYAADQDAFFCNFAHASILMSELGRTSLHALSDMPTVPPCQDLPPPPVPPTSPPAPPPVPPVPPASPPAGFVVQVALSASGDVADYTPAVKESIAATFAEASGVDISAVSVEITAGSVVITIEIRAETEAAASSVQATLAVGVATPAAATAFLSTVSGISIEVGWKQGGSKGCLRLTIFLPPPTTHLPLPTSHCLVPPTTRPPPGRCN